MRSPWRIALEVEPERATAEADVGSHAYGS